MKITTIGRQMTVPEDMKPILDKKLAKLDKYFAKESEATVTFSTRKNSERLEITIQSGGTLFRSEVEGDKFRNDLDQAISNIERQIRKNKTRLEKHMRQNLIPTAIPEIPDESEDLEHVIREKHFAMEPMTPEEAIMQMNLSGHEFYVFLNTENSCVCVVYTRKDGDYGLIIPSVG